MRIIIDTEDLTFVKGQSKEKTRAQNAIRNWIGRTIKYAANHPHLDDSGVFNWFASFLDAWECPIKLRGCGAKSAQYATEILRKWGVSLRCPCGNKYCPLTKKEGASHA